MPRFPPGLQFLLRHSLTALVPAMVVWFLLRFLVFQSLHIEHWGVHVVLVLITLLSVPSTHAIRIIYRNARAQRAAEGAGAVLPPRLDGRLLGNRDLLQERLEKFKNGYMGEGLWDKVDALGHLHSIEIFWNRMYMTDDANVLKTILATKFTQFEKGVTYREMLHSVFGSGVFNVDGDLWKFHRSMTRLYFSRDRISHFALFNVHADTAISKMKERLRAGHAVDFQDLIQRYTLDSATEFLLGTCVHSLKSPLSLPHSHNDPTAALQPPHPLDADARFSEAIMSAQRVLATRLRLGGVWHLKEFFHDRSAEHMRVIDEFMRPILEEAIAKRRASEAQGKETVDEDRGTLLDHLVQLTDDPVLLHDETLNILIAGRDTTASTLTFVVYLMCLNPNAFKRLRQEVLETCGPTEMPTFDGVKKMKYLRAVINETLRLYPVVPFNLRVATRDTTIPNPKSPAGPPVFVPANTPVAYSAFMLHRRKDYWGPDALSFDPDRWLDERLNKYFAPNPFIFLPFNAGPRICLGQQFAYNEISFFLIRLIQNVSDVQLDLSAQPPESRPPPEWAGAEGQKGVEKIMPRCLLTLYLEGGLWVRMTEAETGSCLSTDTKHG
ncbi:cytochrome P450 monooxygenase pc-2 [Cubamyces lactineus]|nr:cytochrome P450 monooxygenase pc-2 [Cubamyces lactineus]